MLAYPSYVSSFLLLATNTSYHEEYNDFCQLMNHNNNRLLYENASAILHNKKYHFEPIDRDFSLSPASSSSQSNTSSIIQRPIPISNTQQQYVLQPKRNSTINIDSTIRSYALPRSMTSDQLTNNNNNTTNRLYYYPSVQDVLDALNRRSFDKESYV